MQPAPTTTDALPKCPNCGRENDLNEKLCVWPTCQFPLKTSLECLRTIDISLTTIRRIGLWFVTLSVLAIGVGVLLVIVRN